MKKFRSYTFRIFFGVAASIACTALPIYGQQLVTEWVALVDGGKQFKNIADAQRRKESFERGGGKPETKVEWTDYWIVMLPGNKFQVSVGLHKTIEELSEIIIRWQAYNKDHHFQILKLQHHGEASVWAEAATHNISYVKYSGNVALSLRN